MRGEKHSRGGYQDCGGIASGIIGWCAISWILVWWSWLSRSGTAATSTTTRGHSRTGGLRPHLVIGPAVTGEEIEVMFVVEPPETVVIFHVMQVRPKIMRIALRER